MVFTSYAQNLEDVMLWRALGDQKAGFYIDVGAAWPTMHSVTYAFYQRGWSGINVEPNEELHSLLAIRRPKDVNLGTAVSNHEGTTALWLIPDTGLSTLDEDIAAGHAGRGLRPQRRQVGVTTLRQLWDQHVPESQAVHFLKVDAEGSERQILEANDWSKHRPWIVVVEATRPLSSAENHEKWEPILSSAHYVLAYADGLNRFYVASEHDELLVRLRHPPNVFDDYVLAEVLELRGEIERARGRAEAAERQTETLSTHVQFCETFVHQLQGELAQVYASASWRLTAPLRRFNPEHMLRAALPARRNGGSPTCRAARHDSPAAPPPDFERMRIGGLTLNFERSALMDRRGIGRASRELRAALRALAAPSSGRLEPTDAEVSFYPSIHWCPADPGPAAIVMIHDVIPLLLPDLFPKEMLRDWEGRLGAAARNARHIVTVSASSARDIARLLDIPPENITVIPNGVTRLPVAATGALDLPTRPYLVFLGSSDHHKNIKVVFEALADPALAGIELVMIGENQADAALIRKTALDKRVHFVGRVRDDEVGALLTQAVALVCPSLYEGFGLPPFEAALLGVPSICSRRPAMAELLDGCALFADPTLGSDWAHQIGLLAQDGALRARLGAAAKAVAETFTWARSAASLAALARQVSLGSSVGPPPSVMGWSGARPPAMHLHPRG